MMKKLILALTCLTFSLHSFALETDYIAEEKPKNIYFQDHEAENKINTDFGSEQSVRCEALSAQIKGLAGKPLRRSASREQYKLECSN